jgi:cardiolipin synthase
VSAFVGGNQVTLHHDAGGLDAMAEAIAAAEREVLFEMYWFASDATGWRFAHALMAAATRGLTVRVVYDAVGSIGTDEAIFASLRAAGCEVHEYHPIAPWRERHRWGRVGHRNHRKLLVVDGEIAMIGGVNVADQWAREEEGGGGWRDDLVAIAGPAVPAVREIFVRCWGTLSAPVDESDAGEAFDVGDAKTRVLANHYRDERKVIRGAYLERIAAAQRSIYIANSYFVPDRRIRRALTDAAARGVDVRVLVPGINDVPIVAIASRAFYSSLLRGGVRIYEWQGPVMHAKTAVIDASWLTIGTFNLDARSLNYNLEINAMIEDDSLGEAAEARFLEDLGEAREVRYAAWRLRPWTDRLIEGFVALFAGWL